MSGDTNEDDVARVETGAADAAWAVPTAARLAPVAVKIAIRPTVAARLNLFMYALSAWRTALW